MKGPQVKYTAKRIGFLHWRVCDGNGRLVSEYRGHAARREARGGAAFRNSRGAR